MRVLARCCRQYTYKFASKLVQMIPKIRRDTMQNKVQIQVGGAVAKLCL